MFGQLRRQRDRKREKQAFKSMAEKQRMASRAQEEKQFEQDVPGKVNQAVQQAKEDRAKARQEGRAYGEEVFSRDQEGLSPQQKNQMQFEANKQIQRSMQSANRKLLGDQGARGIVGQGGVGYAQQRDLQRMGQESQGQAMRDINKLDYDTRMQKLAATFGVEQGEAAQAQLDRQLAQDELRLEQERKRQRDFEDRFYQQFTKV